MGRHAKKKAKVEKERLNIKEKYRKGGRKSRIQHIKRCRFMFKSDSIDVLDGVDSPSASYAPPQTTSQKDGVDASSTSPAPPQTTSQKDGVDSPSASPAPPQTTSQKDGVDSPSASPAPPQTTSQKDGVDASSASPAPPQTTSQKDSVDASSTSSEVPPLPQTSQKDILYFCIPGNNHGIFSTPESNSEEFHHRGTEENVSQVNPFEELKLNLLGRIDSPYVLNPNSKNIQIIEHYTAGTVKLNVTIFKDFTVKIFIHQIELSKDHDFWLGIPVIAKTPDDVTRILDKLTRQTVCFGNCDEPFQELIPVGAALQTEFETQPVGYRYLYFLIS